MGDGAVETDSRRGATGASRNLGSRLSASRHQAQGRAVESGGGGRLSRCTGCPILEEGG